MEGTFKHESSLCRMALENMATPISKDWTEFISYFGKEIKHEHF
jgi:hypothetical protein